MLKTNSCRRPSPSPGVQFPTTQEGTVMSTTAETERPARNASSSKPANVNPFVAKWVEECIALCQPDQVMWCNGSKAEREALLEQGVRDDIFIKLNQQKLPNCYLHRSNPNDVARSEQCT